MSTSVIIPARNEVYLQRTIENVLARAEGDVEVIAVCDGYWPDPPIEDDPRVIVIHHTTPIGQRGAINEGARIAKGKYIMKLDAHCALDQGFDVKLEADCEYEWTVIPRMYNLDHETWLPKCIDDEKTAIRRGKLHDYMFVGWNGKGQLRTLYYPGMENKKLHERKELIDDTMSCMGCCFFMHKDRFWELGGCDEDHGGWGQQGIEVSLKAWLSGGALKVNKKTWFAHWFRGGGGPGFPYSISGNAQERARKYSMDLWLNNKWPNQKMTIEELVEKFKPPTWDGYLQKTKERTMLTEDEKEIVDKFHKLFFRQWNIYTRRWLGVKLVKYPTDLFVYQSLIYENKPDVIIETGSYMGGGALFFASMCDLVGNGQVISVDRREIKRRPQHPRITYVIGRATATDTLARIKELVGDKTCMVVLDSDHRSAHVKRELVHYGKFVTKGQYMIVEDTMLNHPIPSRRYNPGPMEAVQWYLEKIKDFSAAPLEDQFLISMCPNGFLRRK